MSGTCLPEHTHYTSPRPRSLALKPRLSSPFGHLSINRCVQVRGLRHASMQTTLAPPLSPSPNGCLGSASSLGGLDCWLLHTGTWRQCLGPGRAQRRPPAPPPPGRAREDRIDRQIGKCKSPPPRPLTWPRGLRSRLRPRLPGSRPARARRVAHARSPRLPFPPRRAPPPAVPAAPAPRAPRPRLLPRREAGRGP